MVDLLTRLEAIRTASSVGGTSCVGSAQERTSLDPFFSRGRPSLEERAAAKGLDVDEVVERAAIMEYDGGVPREIAEQYALGEITDGDLLKWIGREGDDT